MFFENHTLFDGGGPWDATKAQPFLLWRLFWSEISPHCHLGAEQSVHKDTTWHRTSRGWMLHDAAKLHRAKPTAWKRLKKHACGSRIVMNHVDLDWGCLQNNTWEKKKKKKKKQVFGGTSSGELCAKMQIAVSHLRARSWQRQSSPPGGSVPKTWAENT